MFTPESERQHKNLTYDKQKNEVWNNERQF